MGDNDPVRHLLQRFGRSIEVTESITSITLHYDRGTGGFGVVLNGQVLQLNTGLPNCVQSLLDHCMTHQKIAVDKRHNMTTQAKRSVGE